MRWAAKRGISSGVICLALALAGCGSSTAAAGAAHVRNPPSKAADVASHPDVSVVPVTSSIQLSYEDARDCRVFR
jgi:hypothetical protein